MSRMKRRPRTNPVVLALVASALVALAPVRSASAEPLRRVRIQTPAAAEVAAELDAAGFDVLEGSVGASSLDLVVTAASLDDLAARGLKPVLIATGGPFIDAVPGGYPDLAAIVAQMQAIATAHPDICRLVDLTASLGTPATVGGRHLFALEISDNPSVDEDEPAFLMVSCHHAREIVTPVLALQAIQNFVSGYGSEPAITALVNTHELWVAPVWNPDGYSYVFTTDEFWRKNRHVFSGGVGVDLNRNYPQGWSGACAGSSTPSSDTYKGPSAASEAETQTMMALSQREHFEKVLDYHSAGREVLHGYDCWTHPFDTFMQQEATQISMAAGYGGFVRPPSSEGENYEWQFATLGAYAYLMETELEFQPPYASALAEAARVWPATLLMLQRPTPLWGHVTDAATGAGVAAAVSYVGVSFLHGETNGSGGSFGRYHAFLPPGVYDVRFQATDYATRTISGVAIGAGTTTQLDVALTGTRTSVAAATGGDQDDADRLLAPEHAARPVIRYHLGHAGGVRLEIFDARGRRVRAMENGPRTAGDHAVTWDGMDDHGRAAASGVYFARFSTDRADAAEKLVLAR
jgi:carboxypeptidase T